MTLAHPLRVRAWWRVYDLVRLVVYMACLGISRALIRLVPFAELQRWLGPSKPSSEATPELSPKATARALRVSQTLRRAAARTPWESNCYAQALTARLQLGMAGIPHTVSFGLRRNDQDALEAHAWVVAGEVVVAGGGVIGDYTEVSAFTWVPRKLRATGTPA